MSPNSSAADAIAATLRLPKATEELRPRPLGLALQVLSGPALGRHNVTGDEITVGRSELCDITLEDPSVSEFHFRLTLATDHVHIEDLGSSNGVWIERARIEEGELLPSARFRAGAVHLQLVSIDTEPSAVAKGDDFFGLRACSESMRAVFSLLSRVAPTPLSVLVSGETGVGKGMVARALHRASRRPGPFVTVDCTSLPREMADGLLFGHMKGAFTGATAERASPFEDARGGTVFLDEIGELPLELQPKLLRVIDERVVQRLGSNTPRPIDVRVVAATNRHVTQEIAAGRFRADLYHRLAGLAVRVPPLRKRREDIGFLASIFLEEVSREVGRPLALGEGMAASLALRRWTGNARELRHTIHRAGYLCDGTLLGPSDFIEFDEELAEGSGDERARASTSEGVEHLQPLVDEFKRDYCRKVLARSTSVAAAARLAGFSPRGFQLMLRKLGLSGRELLNTVAQG